MRSFIFITLFYSSLIAVAQDKLIVGVATGPGIKNKYYPIIHQFELETGIKVELIPFSDMKLLDEEKRWFTLNGQHIDVFNAHASRRVHNYAKAGKLYSLNPLWEAQGWDKNFAYLKPLSSVNHQVLGLPVDVDGWHLFYQKSLLARFGGVPTNLTELVQLCKKLNDENIIPFYIPAKTHFVIMAWFEYLVLRTHGLSFFNQLMQGNISFYDERVFQVFNHWKSLIDANCFHESYGELGWVETLPYFYRKKIAMYLMGSYFVQNVRSEATLNDLAISAFPKISEIPRYESMPVNIFIANQASTNKKAIDQFFIYIAKQATQERIAQAHNSIPAFKGANTLTAWKSKEIETHLKTAAGYSPFIDRALIPEFEMASRAHFLNFLRNGDIKYIVEELEQLRLKHYAKRVPK